MSRIKKFQLLATTLLTVGILAGCTFFQEEGPVIQPFEFTDQHGEPFGMEQLKGKVWIADFIFTNCETVCPPMTFSMSEIQEELATQGLEAEIVSFSVDPAVDSPEVLEAFIRNYTDDQSNWHLLTGYSQEEIEKFALEEFQTLVHKPKEADQVLHGISFFVISPDGVIVEDFNFTEPDLIPDIVKEVARYQP